VPRTVTEKGTLLPTVISTCANPMEAKDVVRPVESDNSRAGKPQQSSDGHYTQLEPGFCVATAS
jgi:hypothetical protein